MSIKSDRWIRKMALEHGMITPFEEKQVREGAISYGVSSYGYDIRVADEYKIFTNVNTTIVDPKHFDESSFVNYKGEICTIPPNSFVLARTIEAFKIPRNVLAICVGKSTYARCFRGNTVVQLSNQRKLTLEQMANRHAVTGENFWGYAVNDEGLLVITELVAPRWIEKSELLEVVLDTGDVIQCTPDHKFMLHRDRSMIEAQYLQVGMSLFPSLQEPRVANKSSNRQIAQVRSVKGEYDVFCVSAPETGNFALNSGVVVSNCGLIVNVTPLEPAWSGILTLEISNTTPLPARIYSNEGIAQLLFFESDEVCEISYADRKGKYQNQVDVTLPRL